MCASIEYHDRSAIRMPELSNATRLQIEKMEKWRKLTMLLTLLTGCWMDFSTLPTLNVDEINFTNEYLEVEDVRVRIFESPLLCPDGKKASYFLVYPISEEPLPIAIVFHSGAIDFTDTVSEGESFVASNRLLHTWASSRVWETLNLSRKLLDTAVTDLGYLPTSLSNAHIAQLYPTNCWGDYWHNGMEVQANDSIVEGFSRQGLDMASLMIDMLQDPVLAEEIGFTAEQPLNTNEMYWIGMGSGGHAMIELLKQGYASPTAVIFDSTPATLTPYITGDFPYEQEAFSRIFGDSNISAFDLSTVNLPDRSAWIWSNGDPQHPYDSLAMGASLLESNANSWVLDTNQIGHVFINKDIHLANQVAHFLQTGEVDMSAVDSGQ